MNHKISTMLGFAQKAGKLVSGENGCEVAIKKGETNLIIISEDASHNTKIKIKTLCSSYNIRHIEWGWKNHIGQSIGKSPRAVIGVVDKKFAEHIWKLYLSTIEYK